MIRVRGSCWESPCSYIRRRVLGLFPSSSPFIMSLSDQRPYAMFVAGGLQSPALAKAQVNVGDNAIAYSASADVVAF